MPSAAAKKKSKSRSRAAASKAAPKKTAAQKKADHAQRARKSNLKRAEGGFEIGKPPLTAWQRKEGVRLRKLCEDSLLEFNRIFKHSTGLKPLGQVQIDSIEHDQVVIERGGKVNKAEPRGYGKTARVRHAGLWGTLTGRRRMIPVFKASADKAKDEIVKAWQTEILNTPQLLWMFPNLIWPLVALKGVAQSARRQTFNGVPTGCEWTTKQIVFPTVKGEPGSGAVLMALALKSARGANYTSPSGEILRPDLCIFDDVQKDEDADNPNTIAKLIDLIDHTALRLGGHSRTLAAIMCNTIRRENDLPSHYQQKQGWLAVRYKMLEEPSANEDWWMGEYAETLLAFDRENPKSMLEAADNALKLYKKNRKKADKGAVATWSHGYAWADDPQTEISAVQHAYNIKILEGDSVFQCECQNEPLKEETGIELLTVPAICRQQGRYKRHAAPEEAAVVVSMVDVHPQILDYELWAFDHSFTGWKIDAGTFPDQRRLHFNHDKPPIPLSLLFPGMDDGPRTYAALRGIFEGYEDETGKYRPFEGLGTRVWQKAASGEALRLSKSLVDANGRESTEIRAYCTESPFSSILVPSFGKGLGINDKPISQWSKSFKGNYGPEWVPTEPKSGETPGVIFDANYYKTLFHRKLGLPEAAKGRLHLWQTEDLEEHERAAQGYLAEKPKQIKDAIREVIQWALVLNRENHPLDCAVGCLVAASMAGIRPAQRREKKKKVVKFSEKLALKQKAAPR